MTQQEPERTTRDTVDTSDHTSDDTGGDAGRDQPGDQAGDQAGEQIEDQPDGAAVRRADDGIAPLINNTGDDDDAAPTG